MTPQKGLSTREMRRNYLFTRAWLTRIGIDDATARICASLLIQGGVTTLHELAQIMKKTRPYVTKLRDDMLRSPFSVFIGEDPTVGNVKKGRPITLLWTPEDLCEHVEWLWITRFKLAKILSRNKNYWFSDDDSDIYRKMDENGILKKKFTVHVLLAELMGLSYPMNYLFPFVVYHSVKGELVNPHEAVKRLEKNTMLKSLRLHASSHAREVWNESCDELGISVLARQRIADHLYFENVILPELNTLPEERWFHFSMDDFRLLERALHPKLMYMMGRRNEVGFILTTNLEDVVEWLTFKMIDCNLNDFKKFHLPFLKKLYDTAPRTSMPTFLEFAYTYKLKPKLESAFQNARHVLGIFFDEIPSLVIDVIKETVSVGTAKEIINSEKSDRHVPLTTIIYVPLRFFATVKEELTTLSEFITLIPFDDEKLRSKEHVGQYLSTNHLLFFWNDMGNASYLRFKTQFNLDFPAIYFIDPIKVLETIKAMLVVVQEMVNLEKGNEEVKQGLELLSSIMKRSKVRL